eukprot:SAG11_NODE_669_length_7835_cov_20.412229_1_plen_425_part_00
MQHSRKRKHVNAPLAKSSVLSAVSPNQLAHLPTKRLKRDDVDKSKTASPCGTQMNTKASPLQAFAEMNRKRKVAFSPASKAKRACQPSVPASSFGKAAATPLDGVIHPELMSRLIQELDPLQTNKFVEVCAGFQQQQSATPSLRGTQPGFGSQPAQYLSQPQQHREAQHTARQKQGRRVPVKKCAALGLKIRRKDNVRRQKQQRLNTAMRARVASTIDGSSHPPVDLAKPGVGSPIGQAKPATSPFRRGIDRLKHKDKCRRGKTAQADATVSPRGPSSAHEHVEVETRHDKCVNNDNFNDHVADHVDDYEQEDSQELGFNAEHSATVAAASAVQEAHATQMAQDMLLAKAAEVAELQTKAKAAEAAVTAAARAAAAAAMSAQRAREQEDRAAAVARSKKEAEEARALKRREFVSRSKTLLRFFC